MRLTMPTCARASGTSLACGTVEDPAREDQFPGAARVLRHRNQKIYVLAGRRARRSARSVGVDASRRRRFYVGTRMENAGSIPAFVLGCADRGGRRPGVVRLLADGRPARGTGS